MAWQTLLPQQDYQGHPSALPLHSQRGRPAKAHNVGPRNEEGSGVVSQSE